MLAQKSKYALRALLVLAKEYGQGPVLISDIAHREAIPHKFLELILLELRNHGILGSKKGKGGGYFLTRAPEAVHLGEVLRVLEGPLAPLPCAIRSGYIRCTECRDERTSVLRTVIQTIHDAPTRIL